MKNAIRPLDRLDALIAALSGAGALALYVRSLAPDILYGDSAEFQTLAYTLGHTHSTGYPIYLLLARLVGFLPLNSPAWRVTLFSALMGAAAVAGVYLLGRMLTNSRAGAWLGCLGLALSYTLWSHAVISEVYAPGAAFLAWILLLTLRWQQNPSQRAGALFSAALLAGLSLGIHATCALAALPAAGFVPLWLAFQRADRAAWRRSLLAGAGGAALGTALWLAAFLYIDWHNPPSSFINTTLYPHRSIWGLAPADLDSAPERIILTMNSIQWKDVLFAGGADAARESLVSYLSGIAGREFSVWFMLLGFYGWWTALARSPWRGGSAIAWSWTRCRAAKTGCSMNRPLLDGRKTNGSGSAVFRCLPGQPRSDGGQRNPKRTGYTYRGCDIDQFSLCLWPNPIDAAPGQRLRCRWAPSMTCLWRWMMRPRQPKTPR